jgi:hypothetical protein
MESTLIASNTKYLGNWVSKLSQSCLKVVSKLRQLWSQHCIQQKYLGNWVSKLSQSCLKVVSKLSQSCRKVVSKQRQSCGVNQHCTQQKKKSYKQKKKK